MAGCRSCPKCSSSIPWAACWRACSPPGLRRLVLLKQIFPPRAIARAPARRYQREVVDGDRSAFSNWNGGQWRIADPARFPPAMLALYAEARARAGPSSDAAAFNPRAEETDHLDQRLDRHSLLGSITRRDDTSTSPRQMRLLRHLLVRAPEWLVRRAAPSPRTRGSAWGRPMRPLFNGAACAPARRRGR